MILRFDNTIFDLRYAEKITLDVYLLKIRFSNGKEEAIDLREYNCKPRTVFEIIYRNKDRPVRVEYVSVSKV